MRRISLALIFVQASAFVVLRTFIAARMSDWEEDADESTSVSKNAYIPPGGRGWYNSFDKTANENFSDARRPGFGRGRANRFGNSTESRDEYSNPGSSNGYSREVSSGRYGRGDGGFGRRSQDSKFSRGDNSWRGDRDENNDGSQWRDRGARENSRGFGRLRGGQGRERNSTKMMVPSDDVRFIIGML